MVRTHFLALLLDLSPGSPTSQVEFGRQDVQAHIALPQGHAEGCLVSPAGVLVLVIKLSPAIKPGPGPRAICPGENSAVDLGKCVGDLAVFWNFVAQALPFASPVVSGQNIETVEQYKQLLDIVL